MSKTKEEALIKENPFKIVEIDHDVIIVDFLMESMLKLKPKDPNCVFVPYREIGSKQKFKTVFDRAKNYIKRNEDTKYYKFMSKDNRNDPNKKKEEETGWYIRRIS